MLIKPGMFLSRRGGILLAAGFLGLALAGCGGGGGGGGGAPAPVTVSIGAPVGLGNSPISKISFPVLLSGPAYGALTINYATTDEGAVGGADCNVGGVDYDYVKTGSGTLTIPSGASSGSVDVQVCDPSAFANAAGVKLTLTSVSGNGLLSSSAKTAYGLIAAQSAGRLNDTGTVLCSDGTALTTCPVTAMPGQDASSGRDVGTLTNTDADGRKGFAFAKVGDGDVGVTDRQVLSVSSASSNCVQDNVTGLTWEAKTNANKADTMTWDRPIPQLIDGIWVTEHVDEVTAYVNTVNAKTLCGYGDWRLPTPQELASLVDSSVVYSPTSPAAIDQEFFAEQQKGTYWSKTSAHATGDATGVWAVNFEYGLVSKEPKTNLKHVRLVRSRSPIPAAPVYSDDGETVTDLTTGLMWQKCVDGLSGQECATGAALPNTWQGALNRVKTINVTGFAGFNDWRLPNRNELASIVDYTRRSPALTSEQFKGFPVVAGVAQAVWTSTPYATSPNKAWFVGFNEGEVGISLMTSEKYILLVRGGQ